jgi:Fe2+ transport system protein FeoA
MVTCALCGLDYTPGGEDCTDRGCPLAFGRCRFEHCPRCGYSAPASDRGVAGGLRRLWDAPHRPFSSVVRLGELRAGSAVLVDRVEGPPDVAALLTLLGVTAGSRLHLIQRFPSFVVRVDGTEMAFERNVAEAVWVRRAAEEAGS